MLARAREQGFEFKMGLELEYFLVRQLEDGSIELADKFDTLEKPCYDMSGLTRQYDFLTTVSKYTNELAVMMDSFRPLKVAKAAVAFEDPKYHQSWVESQHETFNPPTS